VAGADDFLQTDQKKSKRANHLLPHLHRKRCGQQEMFADTAKSAVEEGLAPPLYIVGVDVTQFISEHLRSETRIMHELIFYLDI